MIVKLNVIIVIVYPLHKPGRRRRLSCRALPISPRHRAVRGCQPLRREVLGWALFFTIIYSIIVDDNDIVMHAMDSGDKT